ncbi:hypothetical protein [Pleionea sp. CnH1-48]|uniref:DUF7919 family protein n=1 Tax=Pleionea sp. CnH1-48 TaxID=2954494 RepID=UPI002096AA51|nr:hypothetical protein [Pleionea sp. CnH1-48]MCO7223385.1 hypothetical protein [Pleionea sp. CnH1-48]
MFFKRRKRQNKDTESQENAFSRADGAFVPDFTRREFSSSIAYSTSFEGCFNGVWVGWLGTYVPNEGNIDSKALDIIMHFKQYHYVDTADLGYHTCELCNQYEERGEFVIETKYALYYLPQMIDHYISEHNYLPPTKFIQDILEHWETIPCKKGLCAAQSDKS